MKGIVLDYNSEDKRGLIRGEDGERYVFSGEEIKGSDDLELGATVDFDKDGNQAKAIYSITSASGAVSQPFGAGKEAAEKVGGFLKGGKIKSFISGGFDTVCQIGAVLLPVLTAIGGFFSAGLASYGGFHIGAAIGGLLAGLIFGLLTSFGMFGLLFTLIETRDATKRTVELLEKKK